MSKHAYKESKKCRLCGKRFSEQSNNGNPYKWCPDCRARKVDEFEQLTKKVNKR